MFATFPIHAAIYAANHGLLAIALIVRVMLLRLKSRITAGDGGNARLAQADRVGQLLVLFRPLKRDSRKSSSARKAALLWRRCR